MLKLIFSTSFAVLLLFCSLASLAQTKITGKVINASNGDPIPFANVFFQGTQTGTTTDFNGNFSIQTGLPVDSITVSYMGYISRSKKVVPNATKEIDFQLNEQVMNLQEVVFLAGENPAFEILRRAVKNKHNNDKRSLEAYQYESYNKIEIDVDNI